MKSLLPSAVLLGLVLVPSSVNAAGDRQGGRRPRPVPGQTARLDLNDLFMPFRPGLLFYDADRGSVTNAQSYLNFGDGVSIVSINHLDIGPRNDHPDAKARVRVTLSESDPTVNPSGDVVVRGFRYYRNPQDPDHYLTDPASEILHFTSHGELTTTQYFDRVTYVETAGVGLSTTLTVGWWIGHEQEMDVAVGIEGATQADCADHVVFFNGQEAPAEWVEETSQCGAGLRADSITSRGMYFGLPGGERDTFVTAPGQPKRSQWLESLPYGTFFFDVDASNEALIRPVLIELARKKAVGPDLEVVDAARLMLTITQDRNGFLALAWMYPETVNPGAFAQLSPRGLGRLDPTHADTLPYPIAPAGTQPRLSERAIKRSARQGTGDVWFDLSSDHTYWIDDNPVPEQGEFAGHAAYEDILDDAWEKYFDYLADNFQCSLKPPPLNAQCAADLLKERCVRLPPGPSNFRVHVEKLRTFFDPAHATDALVVGDVTQMELSFGADEIQSDFVLQNIAGKLKGIIDPAGVWIEYNKEALDPCTVKPKDRQLRDFLQGARDYRQWLVCRDLSFQAASGALAAPLSFDLVRHGETFATPFAGAGPEFSLFGVVGQALAGTCAETWMQPFARTEIEAWRLTVADVIGEDWATLPSQDEALDRLLSPFELGVESVDDPPPGTPPYSVHPLGTYTLSAEIGATSSDTVVAHANATDGLYIPYKTRSAPIDSMPFQAWFCLVSGAQRCNGLQDTHEAHFTDGRDPAGDPFDVVLDLNTAHLNQALWAQARRDDRLGSRRRPVRPGLEAGELRGRAERLGYDDVVRSLDGVGSRFDLRYYHAAAPYTLITDLGPHLLYVAPNIVVELLSVDEDGAERVAAKFLVDVLERDLQLRLEEGGSPKLHAAWREKFFGGVTTSYLPGCYGVPGGGGCAERLRDVTLSFVRPGIEATLLDLISAMPAPQLFDAGQESRRPRHLNHARTFLAGQGVGLFADLCRPGAPECP